MNATFSFDETKAAQVLGLFVARCGGLFDYYLAVKAVYALDREALLRWGQPVVGGTYRMLPYGPVNQSLMDATKEERRGFLATCFARQGNEIVLKNDPGTDELSAAEMQLAQRICDEWKDLSFNRAHEKAMSYQECMQVGKTEWISPEAILRAAGRSEDQIAELAGDMAALRLLTGAGA